jgi:maltose alpha-D-glucosyltransferase/alpha-amylase
MSVARQPERRARPPGASGHGAAESGPDHQDWFKDAVIYEIHVRAFQDANGDGTGDFDGLTSRLDYLVDLGVTALWLLPFYPSPLRDDGYDIADYRSVNPDFGTMRSFKRFLAAAHDRDLKVITELVINHTSDQHAWFQRARRAPAGSPERDFYVWTDDPTRWSDARIIFQDFEASNWTWDPVAQQYYWHRFYSHQPDLNFDNPAVETAILELLDYWLDMGVDGLRLDAIPYLYERDGTNCENLPETHAFLKRMRAHMDRNYGDRMFLAEANQWPEDAVAYFGDGDECHMNFHFPLMPRMFMAVQMENRTPITDILEQTPLPPDGCQWATFLRNHDELTLEMVTDEERQMMLRAYARDTEMRINLGIRRRLAPLLGNDRRKIELLNGLLFSLPGTPVLYYGDEIGMGDNVYLGDRDGVRTPMQWSSDRNGGFSSSNPHRLYLPLITEQGYHYESLNVDTQTNDPASLLSWMRQLIALRKRRPVLGRGTIEFLDPDNPHVLAFVRSLPDEEPFLCVANLSRLAQHVELDLRDFAHHVPVEAFGHTRFATISDSPYHLTLAPYGFFWFSLEAPRDGAEDAVELPMLRGSWAEVLRRRAALSRALGQWLPTRRWYAGKELTTREVVIEDVVPLRHPEVDVSLLIVRVAFTEGDDHRYAVPVMRSTGRLAILAASETPGAVIASLDDGALLVDAMAGPDGAMAVVASALSRRTTAARYGTARGLPRRPGVARLVKSSRDLVPLGVEQSNSSVIVANRLIAKLVRRLEPGPNPDVELPAHLTAHGFAQVPGVAATLEIDLAGESLPADVVIVHDAIANDGDLWSWTLDELAVGIEHRSEFGGVNDQTQWMAELLGRRTAQLHAALAASDGTDHMAPLPFTLLWQRSLLQTLRNSVRSTQRALARAKLDTPAALALREPVDAVLGRFDTLRTDKLDARRIRVHGDLHLGQILRSGNDITFIDFEGEPGRPIGERRIMKSPLTDVAGLLRSVDYAGRSALDTAVERGLVAEVDRPQVDDSRSAWTRATCATIIDSYLATAADAGLVPADRAAADLLLDAYALQKGLYEVRYELANRPGWVHWPLAAVAEMIAP